MFEHPSVSFQHDLLLRDNGSAGQLDYRFGGGTKIYFDQSSIRFGDWGAGTGTNANTQDPRIAKEGFGALAGGLQFFTNNTARMSISGSTGFVGIGTATPSQRLHVVGNAFFDGTRDITLNTTDGNVRIKGQSGGWATGLFFDGSSGTDRGGFGGYGTNDTLSYYWIGDAYNDTTMVIKPNAGNVGIGTTTPSQKLTVQGNISSSGYLIPAAPSTPSVSAAEASDVINLSITSFDTTANRCEVFRSQTSSTAGFGLVAIIEEPDIAASFSVTDDSYTANTQTWYRVYSVRNGKYSLAGTATITPSNAVADVSNLTVTPFEEGFIITYDLPADRRLSSVTIKKQALAANTGFSEGSATTVYTGLANSYVYVYSAGEKDYYHKFWISTNTAS